MEEHDDNNNVAVAGCCCCCHLAAVAAVDARSAPLMDGFGGNNVWQMMRNEKRA